MSVALAVPAGAAINTRMQGGLLVRGFHGCQSEACHIAFHQMGKSTEAQESVPCLTR